MSARTVTYSSVRDSVLRRRGIDPNGTVTAKEEASAADYITSAYKYCLESYQWTEAIVTATVDCASGLVLWADIEDASWWEFYSEDPRPYDSLGTSQAYAIEVRRSGNDGLWLKTELETVFVRYIAAAPHFIDAATTVADSVATGAALLTADYQSDALYQGALDNTWLGLPLILNGIYYYIHGTTHYYKSLTADIYDGTNFPPDNGSTGSASWENLPSYRYELDQIYYLSTTGVYYLSLAETESWETYPATAFADTALFENLGSVTILAILAEATKTFALSYWYDAIQEHGQASTFRSLGEAELQKLFNRSAAS